MEQRTLIGYVLLVLLLLTLIGLFIYSRFNTHRRKVDRQTRKDNVRYDRQDAERLNRASADGD